MTEKTKYPRVTTILNLLDKPALKQWAVNCAVDYMQTALIRPASDEDGTAAELITDEPETISAILGDAKREWRNVGQKAKDIGSAVHEMIEAFVHGQKDFDMQGKEEIANAFAAFVAWQDANIKTWLASEVEVTDTEIGYMGRLDAIAEMKDGRVVLMDFKNSRGIYDEYRLQVAAYFSAYNADPLADHKLTGAGILRLDKETGLPEWVEVSAEDLSRYTAAFIALVKYYHAQQGIFSKKKK